jgi:hypothetical protein
VTANPNPESARALLYRHGLPEDVIDGVLCLHAQELAAAIRSHPGAIPYRPQLDEDGGFWWDTRDRDAAADLIDPTRVSSAVSVVPPATNQTAPVDRAAVLREAAEVVRSMDSDYALQEAAEHLDGLAVEADEEREAQAHLDQLAEELAAAIASCPGYEMNPNPCRCPCEGCKHHCGAHDPQPAVGACVAAEAPHTEAPDEAAALLALVRDFLDPDPCSFDHHGYCQAHAAGFGGEPLSCPHGRARKLLAAATAPAVVAQPGKENCPAKHGALGRICELPKGHAGMHTGSGPNGGAVWDGDAS